MAANKVGLIHEVGGVDRRFSYPQMGDGQAARLLGIIDEIALGIERRAVADDLDVILGRRDGAIAAQTIEQGLQTIGNRTNVRLARQGELADIVVDADGKTRFRFGSGQLVEDRQGTVGPELLGGEAVTSADHPR